MLRSFVILAFLSMGKCVDVSLMNRFRSVDSPVSTLSLGQAFYSYWTEWKLLQIHATNKCFKTQLIKLVRSCGGCQVLNSEALWAGCCRGWSRDFLKWPLYSGITYFTIKCHRVILFSWVTYLITACFLQVTRFGLKKKTNRRLYGCLKWCWVFG